MPVLKNLDAAYLGANPIDRIYCGATLAWLVTSGLVMDLDAAALTVDEAVPTWPDMTGSYDAVNTTPTGQPTVVETLFYTRPFTAVRFGEGLWLDLPNVPAKTIFIVGAVIGSPSLRQWVGGTGTWKYVSTYGYGGKYQCWYMGGWIRGVSGLSADPTVQTFQADAANGRILSRLNGGTEIDDDTHTITDGVLDILGALGKGVRHIPADVTRVLAYDRVLSLAEIQKVEDYLDAQYGPMG